MEVVQASGRSKSMEALMNRAGMETLNETGLSNETWPGGSIEDFEIASKPAQWFLIALYSITAAVALFGNVFAIVVLVRGQRSSTQLRIFLVNLSMSDIAMAIFSIPFTYTNFVMGRWFLAPSLCPIVQAIQVLSVFVSIYTLTLIGVDRYFAITHPFKKNIGMCAPVLLMLTWFLGLLLSTVVWFSSMAEPLPIDDVTYYVCRENWSSIWSERVYTLVLFVVVFAFPLLCLSYVYYQIYRTLSQHSAPGNANAARDYAQTQAKKKVVKMLIVIVIGFAVCWAPTHVYQLTRVFFYEFHQRFIMDYDASSLRYLVIVIGSHWLAMANSLLNPVIYCFMSENFRADLQKILKKCFTWFQCCQRRGTAEATTQHTTMPRPICEGFMTPADLQSKGVNLVPMAPLQHESHPLMERACYVQNNNGFNATRCINGTELTKECLLAQG